MLKKNCFYTCIPLTENNEIDLLQEIHDASAQQPDYLEWRRDYFTDDSLEVEKRILSQLKKEKPKLIYTFRDEKEGGVCPTDNAKRSRHIENALASGAVDCVDIELNSSEAFMQAVRKQVSDAGKSLILSHHHFEKTYSVEEMTAIFSKMEVKGADILKLAVTAATKEDVCSLITAASAFSSRTDKPMILIAMGAAGKMTRIIPDSFGGGLTYAAGVRKTAPGQVTIDEIRRIREQLNF